MRHRTGPMRIAHVVSHPVPYFAPLYREVARRPGVELAVHFYSDGPVRGYGDREFARDVRQDADLLRGYEYQFAGDAADSAPTATGSRWHADIARRIAAERYDAVWTHGYGHAATWLAAAAARVSGARLMVRDEQTLIHGRHGPRAVLRAGALRGFFAQASAAAYIGEQNRLFLRAVGVQDRRLYPARYCVDNAWWQTRSASLAPAREQIRASYGIFDDAPVVLFAGKLIEKKQPLRLIDAFARVRAKHRCWLLVAGDGPLRTAAEALVSRLAVPGVVFAGMQQPPEMARCYVAADMLALPSWQHETWGLVVNEAMNFGLPVIASDHVGCAADLVLEGRTGAVVPHNDTRRLAETIERMVIDEPGRRAMGRHARELVDRYSMAAAADGIIAACAGEQEVGAWTSRAAIAA